MTNYKKIIRQARREVSKITLEQQKQLLELYDDAIKDLSRKARKSKKDSLQRRWILDYNKELKKVRKELEKEINKQIKDSISRAAKAGIEPQQMIMNEILKFANIDTGNHFTSMFSQVHDNVVKDIISGSLYKDKKTLSNRIWNYGDDLERDIQYTINQAILQKKSAIELAADLERFVREPAKRGSDWGSCYPNLKNKKVDYNGMRLARTAINHAYQTATIQSSKMNPYVDGIKWHSAYAHGRTCELCIERAEEDQYGLGSGVFPVDKVPLDHPNGLCTMISVISKSLNDIADELRAWIDGEDNEMLDNWYNEHGEYFSFKDVKGNYRNNNKNSDNSGIIESGGIKKELSQNERMRAEGKHANLYYESVRNREHDSKTIAKNVGWKESAIEEIREHVFIKEHILGGRLQRFAPDYDQAQAWQRLLEGKEIRESDLVFLKHEYVELTQMRIHDYSYEEAHSIANKYHNWYNLIKDEIKRRYGVK